MASTSASISTFVDPSQQSFQEREIFLLAWATNSCSSNSVVGLEEGWDILDRYGIQIIQRFLGSNSSTEKPVGTKGFTSLYTISYKLSTTAAVDVADYSKILYDRCKKSVEDFLRDNLVNDLVSRTDIEFLRHFAEGWTKHKMLTNWMWRLFANLDKTVVPTEMLPTITSCYLKCYYDLVFMPHVQDLRTHLLDGITDLREYTPTDNKLLKDIVTVISITSCYPENVLVKQLLNLTHLQKIRTHLLKSKISNMKIFQIFMAMGPASTSNTLANLEEALNTRPEPCIYKSQLESFLISVS